LIVTLTLNIQAQNTKTKPRTVMLKRGQVLELSLGTPLDSGHAQVGENVVLKLARPLTTEGVTVLPVDWVVRGRITKVRRAGKNCTSGRIDLKLGRVTVPNGKRIKIQPVGNYFAEPGGMVLDWVPLDTTGKKIRRVALFPVLLPFAILFAIGMWGENRCSGYDGAEELVPAGKILVAVVSKDVSVP
jgi:hypothetical protein